MSPNGRYCLVAVSFDDLVRVIDVATNEVVAELATGDFPLCLAFDSTGDYATVTNYQAGTYTVMHITGDSSSVVGTFSSGQYPMRIAYDPVNDRMGIGNYGAKTLTLVDPRTGALIQNVSYAAYGPLADVAFDSDGNPVVLTASVGDFLGHVHHGTDHVALPAVPSEFDFCPATSMCAVSGPGPDYVSLVDFSSQGQAEITQPQATNFRLQAVPNPCRSATVLHLTAGPLALSPSSLRLFDAQGRLVRSVSGIQGSTLGLDLRAMPAGVYVARVSCGDRIAETRILLVR
jgi:YVTN family beta-propeller protein